MRIIGEIEHPSLKITVFKNDGRTSVKFENPLYEQTFKLGDDERFATLSGVQQLVDHQLIAAIQESFHQMHRNRLEALARVFPVPAGFVFEEII